jgi:VIT1/CCC1 family predicted Fe2+/Mn2+ transporter
VPHLEREELREIYREKGFEGEQLERVVEVLTANPERWIDIMMAEELGLSPMRDSPIKAGFVVGLSYVTAAAVPLIPYVFLDWRPALYASLALTSVALALVGVAKSRFTQRSLVRGALETLLMGLAGTAVCYGIGKLGAKVVH